MTEVIVLMATFQGEKHLREQLDSILKQTRIPDRILARDDGSYDETRNILMEYASARPGLFEVMHGENKGFVGNFLTLVEAVPADAKYIFFCDQDDVWVPEKIQRGIEQLSAIEPAMPTLLFTRVVVTGPTLLPSGLSPLHSRLDFGHALAENAVTGCSMCANSALISKLKDNMPDSRWVVAHDWWLYLMATGFGSVLFDPVPSLFYRQHGGNVEGATVGRMKTLVGRVQGTWTGKWARKRPWNMLSHFHSLYADLLPKKNRLLLEDFALFARGRCVAMALVVWGRVWRPSLFNRVVLLVVILFRKSPAFGPRKEVS
jgi:glycosyltransferase involved in cell wall biosynthesis